MIVLHGIFEARQHEDVLPAPGEETACQVRCFQVSNNNVAAVPGRQKIKIGEHTILVPLMRVLMYKTNHNSKTTFITLPEHANCFGPFEESILARLAALGALCIREEKLKIEAANDLGVRTFFPAAAYFTCKELINYKEWRDYLNLYSEQTPEKAAAKAMINEVAKFNLFETPNLGGGAASPATPAGIVASYGGSAVLTAELLEVIALTLHIEAHSIGKKNMFETGYFLKESGTSRMRKPVGNKSPYKERHGYISEYHRTQITTKSKPRPPSELD